MQKFPSVYPSDIEYRQGRIQSLNAEQEIVLKQCWATLLKFWGYALDLSADDVKNKAAFVVSSIIDDSNYDGSRDESETRKRKYLFTRKLEQPAVPKDLSTKRERDLKNNNQLYEQTLAPSSDTILVYSQSMEEFSVAHIDEGYRLDDIASIDSFQTASDSLEGTLVEIREDRRTKTIGRVPKSSVSSAELVPSLSKHNAKEIHSCLFDTVKNDLIDNFILRFIRARKNHYENTMEMLVDSLKWRKHDVAVEKLLREGDAPAVISGEHSGFVKNFMVNKAFVRGQDVSKNPLFIFQSRKHFASDSSLAETERYALLIIEWCRLSLREVNESVDLCSLMFDLSEFSMKNADNAPVKFLTSIFEAHYPESLGIVIVHNAPWIFSTVWNIIKNWLDPVVASKIHFTKEYADLTKFIEPKYIPEYLGGEDLKPLSYHRPEPKHARPMRDKDERYYRLKNERHQINLRIIETTKRWVSSTDRAISSMYLKDKIYLSYLLSENYISLDPYLRNPGVYDRDGTLKVRN